MSGQPTFDTRSQYGITQGNGFRLTDIPYVCTDAVLHNYWEVVRPLSRNPGGTQVAFLEGLGNINKRSVLPKNIIAVTEICAACAVVSIHDARNRFPGILTKATKQAAIEQSTKGSIRISFDISPSSHHGDRNTRSLT